MRNVYAHVSCCKQWQKASLVLRSVLGVSGGLTVGTWDDSCECALCHGAYEHGGMHATHINS